MDTEINPYAAPRAELLPDRHDAARERLEHLRTEEHLKACGLLFVVCSLTAVVVSYEVIIRVAKIKHGLEVRDPRIAEFGGSDFPWMLLFLWGIPLVSGVGLLFLKRWGGVLACILMAAVTLANLTHLPGSIVELVIIAVILRFLLSAGARHVYTNDYQRVILQTPEIRTRPATWVYPLIVLILMLVVGIFWR